MSVFDEWFTHTVDVQTPNPPDWKGARTSTPHTGVRCRIEDSTQLSRDANGAEFASSTRLHLAVRAEAAWFPPGATVTVRSRTAEVGSIDVVDEGDPDLDGATVNLR